MTSPKEANAWSVSNNPIRPLRTIMAATRHFRWMMQSPIGSRDRLGTISRYLRWQAASRIHGFPMEIPFVSGTKLLARRGLTGATGNYYVGLHEFEHMGFLLHLLRPEDKFIDVGANIGSYTVIASGACGARTLAIEPVPETLSWLCDNVAINKLGDLVTIKPVGLGAKSGNLEFTIDRGAENRVATKEDTHTCTARVETLDEVCEHFKPSLMKCDVEGFEADVLAGGRETLEQLEAIIIETYGHGASRGHSDDAIHNVLTGHGFHSCKYDPFERALRSVEGPSPYNSIYVRDPAKVRCLTESSPYRTIHGQRV